MEMKKMKPIIGKDFRVVGDVSLEEDREISLERMSDVEISQIDWLWKDRVALGKMTLFAGEPGVGKSQLLLYMAAVLSRGWKFHFEEKPCEASNVLIVSGEDSSSDTIKPRLVALGADMDRIHNIRGIPSIDRCGHQYYDPVCLIGDLPEIERIVSQEKYRMMIIDPISMYLGSVDENKNKEIRSALAQISALAERHRMAVVANSHFSKPSGNSTKNAIYRVMGSIGFAAAARIVMAVMKDPEDPERRLFVPIKNNLGDDRIGYVYRISPFKENGVSSSRVEWLKERITRSANDLMNASSEPATPRLEEAKDFLESFLRNGSMTLSEIRRQAEAKGISAPRLYKAKESLNVQEDYAFDRKRGKIWYLKA